MASPKKIFSDNNDTACNFSFKISIPVLSFGFGFGLCVVIQLLSVARIPS